jgi:4,5:9,10-diseco-3-hydroxy-5,9,17-trioxoandrosta-1(10),2-diene-4-oate hydrolase
MQLPADRYVVVDGLRLRYWLEGERGANLVLIHGIGGSVEVWRKQFEHLSLTHHLLALDLPGCGRSAVPATYPPDTLRLLAAAVRSVMQQVGMERAVLVGSSLGGAVALEFAARWPDMVTSLVLIGPAGTTPDVAWALRLMTLPGLGELLSHPDRTRTAHAIRQCVADPTTVAEEDIDRAFALATLPGAQAAFLRLLRTYASVRGIDRRELHRLQATMRTIQAPTLLIWGAQDCILPVSAALLALTHLPNASLIVRPASGHLVFIEEPAWFDQLVAEFAQAPETVLTQVAAPASVPGAPANDWRAHVSAIFPLHGLDRTVVQRLTVRRMATASLGLALLFAVQYARQRRG